MVGWRGGVGQAVLALLERHPIGRALAERRTLVLLDAEPAPGTAPVGNVEVLPAARLGSAEQLREVLVAARADELVDVAGLDWRACLSVCGELGIDSLGTSLERWDGSAREDLLDDAWQLAPGRRPNAAGGSHVLAAGMNPGCVNALVDVALAEFARRSGVVGLDALEIGAIYITERDTTDCDAPGDGFASSWSPRHCLTELLTGPAPWIDRGQTRHADHAPWAARYRVRCGDAVIDGALVPHDEVVTLSWRHPGAEVAYLVELPPRAHRWLEASPRPDAPAVRMWPPHTPEVRGRDVVGVLLCSRRFGELWCGFDTECAQAAAYGTNATLLQVAAGVLAGWNRVGERPGAHVIEELDTEAFVDDVSAILGPWQVHHDRAARFTPLPDRRRPSP